MLRTAISGINEKDVALNKLEREREREVWHVEAVKALKDVGGKRERAREVSGKGTPRATYLFKGSGHGSHDTL